MQTKHIREAFLTFFKEQGHEIVSSSSLIPHHDPSLLFVNAGMVQFKPYFTGEEKAPMKSAATSQKCLRAGGKHNDLDNVGYTARHHTFFEMLGNFSFGDYFKTEAIPFAWDFLTKTLKLPKDKLLVTIYHDDDEAYQLWKKVAGFPDEKIIRIASDDNFWSMGDVGPCGPCTEIFYDHGDHIPGGPPGSPEEDGDRFVEIWNVVFMQYESHADGRRTHLPKPSIDTGIGLERLAAVLQGVHNNYDIDLFQKIIRESVELTSTAYEGNQAVSHRVIADHLRSSAFLMADGVLPSNEGRGYVLRRIMRRAMRHAYLLQYKGALMSELVPTLIEEMGQAFPELVRAQSLISETLLLEEERFKSTLGKGMTLLKDYTSKLNKGDMLPGDVAFKLYDTYGFPLDLTSDIVRADGMTIDQQAFDDCMKEQRDRARAAWTGSGEEKTDMAWVDIRERCGPTEFLGYKQESGMGEVQAIRVNHQDVDHVSEKGAEVKFVVNQSPFYAESGGQIGDTGLVMKDKAVLLEITDTKKMAKDVVVHIGKLINGTLSVRDQVELVVDRPRRQRLRRNHSATHLLHMILRQELGDHVIQKGSLVAEDRLRFDFSHPKSLSLEELQQIEKKVNHLILANTDVHTHLMRSEEAIEKGAMALFGEKYEEEVRVVSMGDESVGGISTELCGGTHVRRTGDIGPFKIISESAIAAGVRRIEAMTGDAVIDWMHQQESVLADIQSTLKVPVDDISSRLKALMEDRKRLEKSLADKQKQAWSGDGDNGFEKDIYGVCEVWSKMLHDVPVKELRGMADMLRKQQRQKVILLINIDEEKKASIIIAVTDDLVDKVDAVSLAQQSAELFGGKGGGGKPFLAQAGGPDGNEAEAKLQTLRDSLKEKLNQNQSFASTRVFVENEKPSSGGNSMGNTR